MKNCITTNSTINILSSSSAVWNALTKPELIKQYFYGTEAISDWQEGSPIIFRGEWEGLPYEDKGTILIAEPDKLFRYAYWSSMSGIEDKPENYVTVTYELFEDGGVTSLDITKENIPNEEFKVHSIQKWRKVINDMKELLEAPCPPKGELEHKEYE